MEYKKDWGPGYRFFVCIWCGNMWSEKSRHCESMSVDTCQLCFADNSPTGHIKHYEWPTDKSGNLIDV